MKILTGNRILILLAAGLALVIGAGIVTGGRVPAVTDMVGADVYRFLNQPFFHIGDLPVSPVFLIKFFLFLVILTAFSRASGRFVQNRILVHTSMDQGQQYALARFSGYLVFLIGLVVGVQSAGVNLSSLVVLGSAVGIGVGFGLQTIASNFISGLILLLERPIKLGDQVEVGGTNGDVVRIASRCTWVRTNDNVVIIVPNSEFVAHRVTNWTAMDRQVRFKVPVGVSYASDPEQVRSLLLDLARRHPDVLREPGPQVVFVGFGDSSLNFELRVWTIKQVQTPRMLTSDLNFAIFRAFREHGIEIPFPQRDVHLKSVVPSAAVPASAGGSA